MPEILTLPFDEVVEMDRAIGSSVRMFSFSTETGVDTLLGDWTTALENGGYSIRPQLVELDQNLIGFSGQNILNAKIATEVASTGDRVVITVDATLK